jgi:hypothetical protein
MRGGGGIGAIGRAPIGEVDSGALTEITGAVAAEGLCIAGGGATGRTGGALTGDTAVGGTTPD